MKIVLIGNVSVDHIIHLHDMPTGEPTSLFAEKHYHAVGGSGIGKALNMNQLDIRFEFITRFAEDKEGSVVKEELKEKNIPYKHIIDPESTVTHTNLMDRHGDRISIFTSNGSLDQEIDVSPFEESIMGADLIILNISNFCKDFIPLIKKSNAKVWTDLHDYDGFNEYHQDFIDIADVIFMSSDKLRTSYEEVCLQLLEHSDFVICTHGKLGANYYDDKETHKCKIKEGFKRVDTNGAGDAFFSGFLYGYINSKSIDECLCYGAVAGGYAVSSNKLYSDELNTETIKKDYE